MGERGEEKLKRRRRRKWNESHTLSLCLQGGSLDNALVCDREKGWLNPPTRFDNEPARHKLLDLIGDIALLPALPMAHIIGYRSGHALHVELARKILCHWQSRGMYVP